MNPGLIDFTKRRLRSLLKRAGHELDVRSGRTLDRDPGEPQLSPGQLAQLRAALTQTYFTNWEAGYLETEVGEQDMAAHVSGRYGEFCRYILPWIQRSLDLTGKEILEIGCGTGSATAGIAPMVGHVQAYDIDRASIAAAQRRCEIFGIRNVDLVLSPAESLLDELLRRSSGGCDVCLLNAVLEHQTLPERLATLRACWSLLRPGGILVVNDTPNRLVPVDPHTSRLPFFQMLPDELALLVAKRSPRAEFRKAFAAPEPKPEDRLALARWGRGVSYHEFEVALGLDLAEICVGDGYQNELLRLRPLQPEELSLKAFAERAGLTLPASFTRAYIEVILRKPGGSQGWAPLRSPRSPALQLQEVELRPDGTLVLSSSRSSVEFAIEGNPSQLSLGLRRDPWSGVLRIIDPVGRVVHREELTRLEGTLPHYLDVPIRPGVSRLRLAVETPRLLGSRVHIHYLGLR